MYMAATSAPRDACTVSLRALTHPWSLGAVLTLLVNDHVLKGLAPGWITGKLSDFAGLFFFPFLLTLAFGLLRLPRPHVSGFAMTAVWFAAIKTNPQVADAMSSLFPWSSRIIADPTDLVALVALLPAYSLWRSIERAQPIKIARRDIRTIAAACLAAASAIATSAVDPPSLGGLATFAGDVYVTNEVVLVSEDAGATWSEVEELPEGALAAIQTERAYLGIRCQNEQPNVCYKSERRPNAFEASFDGGITWEPLLANAPPDVFGPAPAVFLELFSIGCDETALLCVRDLIPPTGRSVREASDDAGTSWETLDQADSAAVPNLERVGGARCSFTAPTECFRALRFNQIWHRSTDGGLTWPEPLTELPEIWRSHDSVNDQQVRGAACVSSALCFRVFKPEGAVRPHLEESIDLGSTWRKSWSASSRLDSSRGVPVDMVVVGDLATLLVSLGRDGLLRRTPEGVWETLGVGSVPPLELPAVTEVFASPFLVAVWLVALGLGLFGLSLLRQSSTETDRATARPWWIGLLPLIVGVGYVPIAATATDTYPYGLFGGGGGAAWIWVVAAIVFIASAMIASRHSDRGVIGRATRTTVIAVVGVLLIALVGFLLLLVSGLGLLF